MIPTTHRTFRALAAMLTMLLALAACGQQQGKDPKDKKPEAPAPVVVETGAVALRPIEASYNATATLEAPNEASVVAKTSGVLLQLLVEEGDRVSAGQVLARLDSERQKLDVQRAEAMLRKLEAERERSRELFERKLIAADVYEKIRFDVDTQKAAWNMARLELSYTSIVAPISGVIASRSVKVGNLIQLNSPLFRIVDAQKLEAVLNVPERELSTMRAGVPVTLLADAVPGRSFIGEVARVSPVVDAGSGTFRVVAAFDAEDALKPGMFARIAVRYDVRDDVLTLPRTALLDQEGEPAVYAVRNNIATRVAVRTGFMSGELVEVLGGIEAGEQVVTAGKIALRDGATVEVIGDTAQQPPAKVPAPGDGGVAGG
ncbi:MAG: efflux RND transporter periplasmic adaptor subunit [Lysobacteraceae bacterium]